MLDFTLRQIWSTLNNAHKIIIGSESIGLVTIIVLLHLLLALATLGLGDRTVCDIARPLRKIFKPDTDSLVDGVVEVTIAVPRAVVYYSVLYVRSYFLALRVLLWLWAAAITALLVPLFFSVAMGLIYGFRTPLSQIGQAALLVPLSFWPALAYFYWRFDGKRVTKNFIAAWQC